MWHFQRPPSFRLAMGVGDADEESASLPLLHCWADARALWLAFFDVREAYASVLVGGSAKEE